ncbi:hypothetical protein [Xanthomonas sacchari]|uniref:hypothetical protein n=1 Tax=Xanthomonas sacchari TaxID=56458 RepID=UPI00225E0222|nr:hypothetical protein [Xanthomonas sacchari]
MHRRSVLDPLLECFQIPMVAEGGRWLVNQLQRKQVGELIEHFGVVDTPCLGLAKQSVPHQLVEDRAVEALALPAGGREARVDQNSDRLA